MFTRDFDVFFSDKVNLEARLLNELMDGYNRHARPTSDIKKAIQVSIAFYITKILNLVSSHHVSRHVMFPSIPCISLMVG